MSADTPMRRPDIGNAGVEDLAPVFARFVSGQMQELLGRNVRIALIVLDDASKVTGVGCLNIAPPEFQALLRHIADQSEHGTAETRFAVDGKVVSKEGAPRPT